MNVAERNRVIQQVYTSEPDYREIQRRVAALLAITSRTAEQDARLADFQTKLQHDRAVIAAWKAKLLADGIAWPPPGRATVLSAWRTREQARRDALAAQVVDELAALAAMPRDLRRDEWESMDAQKRASIAAFLGDRDNADERLTVIDALATEATVWGA